MVLQLQAQAFLLLQERAVSFDILAMWGNMQWPARTIVITLIIMSAWSIGVMIDRWIARRPQDFASGFVECYRTVRSQLVDFAERRR